MSEVKTFKVKGEVKTGFKGMPFAKEVRALSMEEAVGKVYDEIGSKHGVKRHQIKILNAEEIDPHTAKNPLIAKLSRNGEQK
ncbi:MAG: 50S ribosomal protein L18Ae [Candidatus Bathyarchaeia archaeon]